MKTQLFTRSKMRAFPLQFATPSRRQIHLSKSVVWRPARGERFTRLLCESGVCWLTRAGDEMDYVLADGESMTLSPKDQVVVEALEESTFLLY